MTSLLRQTVLCATMLSVVLPVHAQQPPEPLAGIDSYIERAIKEWRIAGLAIAVVKDDSVVYARGFGVRDVRTQDRVDVNTVFAIGSNTKLFTAVLAGMLVDDGRMRWDDQVTKYLPWFVLYDPWVTRHITIRDVLSHRSGLGQRGDMIAYGSRRDRLEVLQRIRYLVPNSSFRSEFGYQNTMVLAAGEATAAATGQSWDALTDARIFRPLGMSSSSTRLRDLKKVTNLAAPHFSDGVKLTPVSWRNIDNIGPAGSINSNVVDMAKWLRFLLARGRVGGTELLRQRTLLEIESPQTIVPSPADTLSPSTHFQAYGLGIGMHDYLGVKVMSHTGGIDGMLSQVTYIPERHLGVVILTNTDGHNALYSALARRVIDSYLGAAQRDWSKILLGRVRETEGALAGAMQAAESRRPKNTRPSLPLDAYAGRYTSETYGDILVLAEERRAVVRFGVAFTGDLQHWAYNTYRLTWRDLPLAAGITLVTFDVDAFGKVRSVRIQDDIALPPTMRFWDRDDFKRVEDGVHAARAVAAP